MEISYLRTVVLSTSIYVVGPASSQENEVA